MDEEARQILSSFSYEPRNEGAKMVATQMTRAEFYDKYGDVEVTFSSYYRFTFTYVATLPNGARLTVDYGGSSDEIYLHSVSAGHAEKVRDLRPCAGMVCEDDEEIEGFYDY